MKRELTYNEILDNITDAYFEVLINDEQEVDGILKEAKIDMAEFDNQTDLLLRKLKRDIQIKTNREKGVNLYEKARSMVKAISNLGEYFENMTETDKQQFQIAFRKDSENEQRVLADYMEEFITIKLMEKLKEEFESREGKE